MNHNPKVDEYIAKAADFAKPVLMHLRGVIHKAAPQITESIKWGMPSFEYKGKILCSMAAFKQHCSFGFWFEDMMETIKAIRIENNIENPKGMGSFGKLTVVKDLPPNKVLLKCIFEAMSFIDNGTTIKRPAAKKAAELPVPEAFSKALRKNKTAKAAFEKAAPSFRKEYIQWIGDAKTEATREKRITTALEWIAEGKGRNWKYERKK
ncbi:YdeI/OmpD-associated family protein [Niabella insulamsoli]|uniref:YdeI/OmpD-associated family protein n=1 Tax=Niabella insulamsoli TaxID=3144874 RepID=UPI0031FC36B4